MHNWQVSSIIYIKCWAIYSKTLDIPTSPLSPATLLGLFFEAVIFTKGSQGHNQSVIYSTIKWSVSHISLLIICYLQQLYIEPFKMEHTPYKVSTITTPIPAPFLTSSHRSHRLVSSPMGSHIRWHQCYWAGEEANHLLSATLSMHNCNFKPLSGGLSCYLQQHYVGLFKMEHTTEIKCQ